MLTWWCRDSLKAATAYAWAVTYTLVLPSVGVPKQSFTSALCLLSSSAFLNNLPCASVTLGSWYWGISLLLGDSEIQNTEAQRSPTPVYRPITPLKLPPQSGLLSPFAILLGLYIFFWWGSPSAGGIRHLHTLQRCSLSLSSLQYHQTPCTWFHTLWRSMFRFPNAHWCVCAVWSMHLSRIEIHKYFCGFSPKCAWIGPTTPGLVQTFCL